MGKILANSIADIKHIKAIDDTAAARFDGLQLDVIAMYIVDTAPSSALFYLARQFGVLGFKGWALAETEEQKRNLIKGAIKLQRTKGTPYAVKESIKSVGYIDAKIIEGVGVDYDGEFFYAGIITYGGGNWATFRVIITLADNKGAQVQDVVKILGLINEYKNARSTLLDLSFRLEFTDGINLIDDELDLGEGFTGTLAAGISYNAAVNYNGVALYEKAADKVGLNITKNGVTTYEEF